MKPTDRRPHEGIGGGVSCRAGLYNKYARFTIKKQSTTTNTPNQNCALARVVNAAIPALSGSNLTYNEKHNIFLTKGYTSAAGNTYFQGIRLSDRLVASYDFGQGWYYLFLNGIRLYANDGKEKKLIASRSFYNNPYSETRARKECCEMLVNFLKSQVLLMRESVPANQIEDFAKALVDTLGNANRKLLQ